MTYFEWSYKRVYRPGVTLSSYHIQAAQLRKDPKVWRGKVQIRRSEGGIEFGVCTGRAEDEKGYLHWEAEYKGVMKG